MFQYLVFFSHSIGLIDHFKFGTIKKKKTFYASFFFSLNSFRPIIIIAFLLVILISEAHVLLSDRYTRRFCAKGHAFDAKGHAREIFMDLKIIIFTFHTLKCRRLLCI